MANFLIEGLPMYDEYYKSIVANNVEYFLININRGIFGFFYYLFIFIRCRSPPSINFKNFKLIGGKNLVKIPVRNRSKDNPYFLGFDDNKEKYIVEFIDNKKVKRKIEISNEVYEAFNKFELDDISQIHKYQRHIEHSEIYEETLNIRAINKPVTVEDIVLNNIIIEDLTKAINSLSEVQKRRIKMYYFEELTQKEIAEKEGTSIRAVQYTLNSAISQLKKYFEKN